MPPCLDVYVITPVRTRETVEKFFDCFVDRAGSDNRGEEELMMLPPGASTTEIPPESWEWKRVHTLDQVVETGLSQPWRAFAVYLTSKDPSLYRAILGFTVDGGVILGVSLDDSEEEVDTVERAKALVLNLAHDYSAGSGVTGVELPPPLLGHPPAGAHVVILEWTLDGGLTEPVQPTRACGPRG